MGEGAHASSRLTFQQTAAHSAADISTAEATANIGAVAAAVVAVAAVDAVDMGERAALQCHLSHYCSIMQLQSSPNCH